MGNTFATFRLYSVTFIFPNVFGGNALHSQRNWKTSLFASVIGNNPQLTKYLVEHIPEGAINQVAPNGLTPLLLAEEKEKSEIVKILLELGATAAI